MKIFAAAIALAALAPLSAAAPEPVAVPAEPSPYFLPLNLVEFVNCGDWVGSGARIDADLVVTAYHVAVGGKCSVKGKPTTIAFADPGADFAVIRTADKSQERMPISCAPVTEGQDYYAVGYAFGDDFAVQRLTGTASLVRGKKFQGMAIFRGTIYSGMSGGPVVDGKGNIVGIVNAGPKSGGILLSRRALDTYLCARK